MANFGVLGQLSQRGARILALAWMAMIFVLSSQSKVPVPEVAFSQDKIMHLIAYAVLGLFLARGWPPANPRHYFYLIAAASGYGLVDEIHQSFVPGRDASIYDWLADTAGGVLGVWWYGYWARLADQAAGKS